ncbi:MAG: AI-2E family transporter [Candidatus Andersenbacteria bacterium]|nr:AI-2E family transporter [Candidatus Andersenbacteria bacterium]
METSSAGSDPTSNPASRDGVQDRRRLLRRPSTVNNKLVRAFFLVVLIGTGWLFVKLFLPYLTAIILAVVLASVFRPLYSWLQARFRGSKTVAAAVTSFLVVLIVVLPLVGFLGLLAKEAADFAGTLSETISVDDVNEIIAGEGIAGDFYGWLAENYGVEVDPVQVRESFLTAAKNAGTTIASSGSAIASGIFGAIVQFLLMIFTLYYLLRDGDALVVYLMDLSPLPDAQEKQVMRRFRDVGGAVFYGNIVSSVLQGIFGGLGFLIFGLPGAFLWGSVMGILALIPLLGTLIVYIPATIILMAQGKWGIAIGFLVFNIVASNVLDNWLKPKLIEKRLRAHPLLVFFSIIGGLSAFGMLGLLYGPIIMTIFLALIEIYKRDFRDPQLSSAAEVSFVEGTSDDRYLG